MISHALSEASSETDSIVIPFCLQNNGYEASHYLTLAKNYVYLIYVYVFKFKQKKVSWMKSTGENERWMMAKEVKEHT